MVSATWDTVPAFCVRETAASWVGSRLDVAGRVASDVASWRPTLATGVTAGSSAGGAEVSATDGSVVVGWLDPVGRRDVDVSSALPSAGWLSPDVTRPRGFRASWGLRGLDVAPEGPADSGAADVPGPEVPGPELLGPGVPESESGVAAAVPAPASTAPHIPTESSTPPIRIKSMPGMLLPPFAFGPAGMSRREP